MTEEGARRIRYSVAMSLDGFIADRDGGYDWIVEEKGIDFQAYVEKIDTLVMGRGTYEILRDGATGLSAWDAFALYVVSTTLEPTDAEGVTVIREDVVERVRRLKESPGHEETTGKVRGSSTLPPKDIWLFGGGVLFRSLLEAGLVDRVEVGVVPVLLGEGIPLLPGLGADPVSLALHSVERFESGIVLLKYDVR